MSQISVSRDGSHIVCCVDTVRSPDEGWWYLRNWDFNGNKSRVSIDNYTSEEIARRAYNDGEVRWDAWS